MKQFYQIHENGFDVIHHNNEISFPLHMHNEIEIIYIFRGRQELKSDGKSAVLTAGSCAVIFPNIQHEYINSDESGEVESVVIFLPPRMLYDAFPSFVSSLPNEFVLTPEDISEDAAMAFEKIVRESIPAARTGWAQIILAHIIPKLEIISKSAETDFSAVSRLMNYVSTNFQNSITLDILSDELGMSKSQISHIFSNKIRIGLRSYVGIRRSEYAAQLMKTSTDTLGNIAAQSGFESLRTFNRVFREVYGVTPSQFRNNIRKYIGQ